MHIYNKQAVMIGWRQHLCVQIVLSASVIGLNAVATDKKRGVFSKEKNAVECVFVCLSTCVWF